VEHALIQIKKMTDAYFKRHIEIYQEFKDPEIQINLQYDRHYFGYVLQIDIVTCIKYSLLSALLSDRKFIQRTLYRLMYTGCNMIPKEGVHCGQHSNKLVQLYLSTYLVRYSITVAH
jgi:hypothetical protein